MISAAAAPSRSSVRVWFDLARAGNFPSVASNVLAAMVLSSAAGPAWPAWRSLGFAVMAGCLAYAGGATFNDVADAKFDAQHRPERAIPRKLVTRAGAAWVGGFELVLGLALLVGLGASSVWALVLATMILVYDWIHKRWIGSVALMAGCRVALALTVASLPDHAIQRAFLGWTGALFVYIVSLSLIARWEYKPGAPAAKLGRMVGRLLAFIPLVDAVALLLVGAWIPAMVCAATVPFGRWTQRLAAST